MDEDVYSIQYHIVWDVKYGHKILTKDIEENLIKILNKIVDDSNFRILEDYIESIKESINIAFLNTEYQRYIVH